MDALIAVGAPTNRCHISAWQHDDTGCRLPELALGRKYGFDKRLFASNRVIVMRCFIARYIRFMTRRHHVRRAPRSGIRVLLTAVGIGAALMVSGFVSHHVTAPAPADTVWTKSSAIPADTVWTRSAGVVPADTVWT
ncbi:hypothetical protein [Kitasatospora sp. LaBMicrA B282]|uniref:hypothetical protein n=1 Tax=Kitasatospora sp. LaBMicrA B282 TaxID=3420949 RepID=UPI003D099A98